MFAPSPGPDLGVVVALPKEAAAWRAGRVRVGHIMRADGLQLIVSGVGAQRAQDAARCLLDTGAGALLSWGVAGGLSSALTSGALVLAEQVLSTDGEYKPDAAWRAQLLQAMDDAGLAVTPGWLWSHDHMVGCVREKQQLATRGCVAVDMESFAVARVADSVGVPFAAVKSICDPADRNVPAGATRLLRVDGRVQLLAVAMALLQGPRTWQALRGMQADFDTACSSLQRAAKVVPLSWAT